MMNPQIETFDALTGETSIREMTDDEYAEFLLSVLPLPETSQE